MTLSLRFTAVTLGIAAAMTLGLGSWGNGAPIDEAPVKTPSESTELKVEPTLIDPINDADDDVRSPLNDAAEAFQNENIEECLAHLRKAVASDPALPSPQLLLAGLYLKAGNRAEGRRLLEVAAAEQTNHPELRLAFAMLALSESRLTDAEAHLDLLDVLLKTPEWKEELSRKYRQSTLAGRVAIAERRRNWDAARQLLAAWVQLQPKDAQLRDRWATALFMAGHESTAFDQFDIAHQQDASINPPEISLAAMHAQRREFDKADAWYAKAEQKYPKSAAVHYEWAIALLVRDRAAEAQEHAESAASLGMETAELSRYRGTIERQLGNWAEAEAELRRALQQSPHDRETNYQLVLTLAEQEALTKRKEALTLAQQFVARDSTSRQAVAALGIAYYRLDQLDEAWTSLERAISGPRPEPEALYFAGCVAEKRQDQASMNRIAAALRPAVEIPGVFAVRSRAKQWLNELTSDQPFLDESPE